MQRDNPARRLDKRLWFCLGLFAGLIVLHQCLIQPWLLRLTADAPEINVAGRQRMLSQKLAKSALAMLNETDPNRRETYRSELLATLQIWRTAHLQLRSKTGAGFLWMPPDAAIEKGFEDLDPHFRSIVSAAETLLNDLDPTEVQRALTSLLEDEPAFLSKMNTVVGLFEEQARRHISQLQFIGVEIMLAILGTLLVVQYGVMRPELSIVGSKWEKIEADYELLVESMTDGLVVFDQQGHVQFANRRFSLMLGYSQGEILGKPADSLLAELDQPQFTLLLQETIAGPVDLNWKGAQGQLIEAMISPRRLTNPAGATEGLLLVVTDVTGRKASERRSRDLQNQLAHADRLKSMGAMAAALAHEINQPLGAISNYAAGCLARLEDSSTSPQDLVPPIRAMLNAAHRGGEIVRRTRNFARRGPYDPAAESINELVHEVEELCRPEARRRSVTIESQLTPDLPAVTVDGIQLQQVLMNLISNAFAALEGMDSDRRRIVLETRHASADLLQVTVKDTGPGISPETARSLFEPFVTMDEHGTGLGLTIARGIVEAHGGRIWCEADQDVGTRFHFSIPLSPPDLSDEAAEGSVDLSEFPALPMGLFANDSQQVPAVMSRNRPETILSERILSVPRAI